MKKIVLLGLFIGLAGCSGKLPCASCSDASSETGAVSSVAALRDCLISEGTARVQSSDFSMDTLTQTAREISLACVKQLVLEKTPLAAQSQDMAETLLAGLAASQSLKQGQ